MKKPNQAELECYTPYVDGVIGAEFKLTFVQRIQALIYGRVTVVLKSPQIKKSRK